MSIAAFYDSLASVCYRIAARIPDDAPFAHAVVVRLLSIADRAARLSLALTPRSFPRADPSPTREP